MPSQLIQRLIHTLELGAGARLVWKITAATAVLALIFFYDLRAYRNFAAPEAMDAAQLARNISEGHGYTTQFIRPFSLYLVQTHNQAETPVSLTNADYDYAKIRTAHPDLANAPVYPLLLAGLMKVLPFHFPVNLKSSFWSYNGNFWRYEPDFLIAIFNEILLLAAIVLTFFLARKLFDASVAWLSAILVLGSELLWHFSASGLSTLLLLLIFLGLAWSLLKIEEAARESQPRSRRLLVLALSAGILTGIGGLTRYEFGWTIIPVVLFLVFFSGPKRIIHALAAFAAFVLILTPWIVRNEMVSGTAFGTAGYAIVEGTYIFPRFQLERSIQPELSHALWLSPCWQKFLENVRALLSGDLLKTFGWAGVLFFAGLFLTFRNAAARRARYFLLMCLGVFIVVQSLGQTQLSEMSPEINSENLLVLLLPLIFIFGAAFFFTLLEQIVLPLQQLRYVIIGFFVALCCLPLFFAIYLKVPPVVYPPYYPPEIQQTAGWMGKDELMMSGVPWAVAWYGDRQCAWLTLNAQSDFFAINDYLKPVQALYLTPETMDAKFISDWVDARNSTWGSFIISAVIENKIPPAFPLHSAPTGFLPDRLFLTDRACWKIAP
ncbi:MAG TPA: glycosyltransferase family 39 protein [Verrucomicrobiae bacterium]|nr:glycosyltransferase family 39 protein [Verrucomicrobiae bacterium]